jgi:hypothetical protein
MGRRLRNDLPVMESLLQPANNSPQRISKYLMKTKEDQKKYHDKHASKELKELQPGAKVLLEPWTYSKEWKPATVVSHHHTPRSYVVQTENGRKYRRNRQHLRVCPALGSDSDDQTIAPAVDKEMSSPEKCRSTIRWCRPIHCFIDRESRSITLTRNVPTTWTTSRDHQPVRYQKWSISGETQTIWVVKLETLFDINFSYFEFISLMNLYSYVLYSNFALSRTFNILS